MDKNMLNEFRRLTGQDKINENYLDDDYKNIANVVATGLASKYNGDSDDIYYFLLNNKTMIKNMELSQIKIITLLGQNPEQLEKLQKKSEGESVNEESRKKVRKAALEGSYPAVIVVTENGKVIHQESVSTPDVAPATFNVMQEKYPKAVLSLEDNTGKTLYTSK